MLYGIAGILSAVGVILILVGRSKSTLKRTMNRNPTTAIRDLPQGTHAEVKGAASCDAPLEAPYSGTQCVYYSYKLERRERDRDADGSTSYSWRTIDSGSTRVPFQLTDATGSVRVDPENAKIDAPIVLKGPVPPGQMREGIEAAAESMEPGVLKTVLGVVARLPFTPDRERVKVHAIGLALDLYVLGDVQQGTDGQVRISKGDNNFFISTKSEEQLSRKLGRQLLVFYSLGVAFIGTGIVILALALK